MAIPFVLGALAGAAIAGVTDMILKPQKTQEIFTTDEAMKILGMSKPTILKKMKEGLIPYEGSGRRGGFRIKRKDIEEYAQKNNIVPDWSNVNQQEESVGNIPDKEYLEALIDYYRVLQDEAKLEFEVLELDQEDSKEYKRKALQAKLKIKNIDKNIQECKLMIASITQEKKEEIIKESMNKYAEELKSSLQSMKIEVSNLEELSLALKTDSESLTSHTENLSSLTQEPENSDFKVKAEILNKAVESLKIQSQNLEKEAHHLKSSKNELLNNLNRLEEQIQKSELNMIKTSELPKLQ